jgi:TupA-like ATPgrasp
MNEARELMAANRNGMWTLHYYANRVSTKLLGISFEAIEHTVLGRRLSEYTKFIEIHGYRPNFRSPRSYNEKICHRKLFDRNPQFSMLADKWAVRAFVEERIGSQYLNEVLFTTSNAEEIPFDALPNRFVIRSSHGSDMNVLVSDKRTADLIAIKQKCNEFLKTRFGDLRNERHYAKIPRRLLFDRFLGGGDERLNDYRFFVFDGRCEFIQLDEGGVPPKWRRFYTRKWEACEFATGAPLAPIIPRPAKLDEMISIAETLCAGFDFMRVDLYLLDDRRIVFGEMTATPGAGRKRFYPSVATDFYLGAFWNVASPRNR